jgi:hypothetical protein
MLTNSETNGHKLTMFRWFFGGGMVTVEMNYHMKKIQIRTNIIAQEIYLLYVSCLFMLDIKKMRTSDK